MPESVRAYVTPAMLRWARERAGCSLEQAGKSAGRNATAVAAWESPDSGQLPTVRQAQKLAHAYRVPLAVLYMDSPKPELEYEALPEFRGVDQETGNVRPQSRQLRWMIRQAQERQAFVVALLEDFGDSHLPWVGSASHKDDPELLGARIRESLGVNDGVPRGSNKEQVLDWWVGRVETLGAFVSRYRPDGNQHWSVEPSEARGLSLCHPLAPYIVLNSKDAPAGRTFTLMHELAHIYFGQCGVDDLADERRIPVNSRELEQRCNQVAAAILMPVTPFKVEWESRAGGVSDKVLSLAKLFGVSQQAVAVRAASYVMGFMSEEQYDSIRRQIEEEYREFRQSRPAGGRGRMKTPVRVLRDYGGKYTRLSFSAYAEERLSLLELADALDVRVSEVEEIRSWL